MKVLLIAGHGGSAPGSIGADNKQEKDRTLTLANKVSDLLKTKGHLVDVKEEKSSSGKWTISNRRGYDFALSIHFNAFNKKATGIECFYKNNLGKSAVLSQAISNTLNIVNRGAKKNTRFYMLNIGFDNLLEICFHDNPNDLDKYNKNIDKVAKVIVEVISDDFIVGLKPMSNKKTNDQIAEEIIKGLWGNGEDRKINLTKAGYNYNDIQNLVNEKSKLNSSVVNNYPKYLGNSPSIVDALKEVNVNSSFSNRSNIAKNNGITNYKGTKEQNTKLLNLLKQGKLKK